MPAVDDTLQARPGQSPPRLVMVARLSHWKDQPALLHALAGLLDLPWQLELVGDGPMCEPVQALAHELGLASRVYFAGFRRDVPERLAAAQLFVLISKWEGLPRSIIEAMRAGLPVIATEVGGVREAVVDGITGFVIPPGDVEWLRGRLRVLIMDSELRIRMGAAGRARYERLFTFDRLVEQTTGIYESVLEQEAL
jgi:glycosyltransferase involved in cell wall biosynthesis